MRPAIIVHGGAGRVRDKVDERLEVLQQAVSRGYKLLCDGASALDAVVEAVVVMEDSGLLNAGLGCALTFDGEAELDAGVMDSGSGVIGAVAAVRRVKNPILLARKVAELTDHLLLVGEGAEKFAEVLGLTVSKECLITSEKLARLEELKKRWMKGEDFTWLVKLRTLTVEYPDLFGTVGAAAVDKKGNTAAATSTGGYWLKLRGRVGDTPIPGAGFDALKGVGACSATGVGEAIIRYILCRKVCELMAKGFDARASTEEAIRRMSVEIGEGTAGVVAVDACGNIGYAFNTEAMLVGYVKDGDVKATLLRRS
ncbi:MAG: isoaspartyl peptidase/L-asparaginase [Thermofilaceae archaeon]|nr:isoaspartyl peptidase/L-asparaginase [Thermofilaceae archaeon]MCX8180429.1 isoaspartyl peptidase/L-asparaginase [Thermofilaceae archaeon]MDW8003374.1 isoaspartyl peptidase/L-asparaginase [Thermofilaceae archaeon]